MHHMSIVQILIIWVTDVSFKTGLKHALLDYPVRIGLWYICFSECKNYPIDPFRIVSMHAGKSRSAL